MREELSSLLGVIYKVCFADHNKILTDWMNKSIISVSLQNLVQIQAKNKRLKNHEIIEGTYILPLYIYRISKNTISNVGLGDRCILNQFSMKKLLSTFSLFIFRFRVKKEKLYRSFNAIWTLIQNDINYSKFQPPVVQNEKSSRRNTISI